MIQQRFSLILLCYNNFQYIFEALESIFSQDYPNIELIISDDGSHNFNVDQLIVHCNSNRGPNIKKIIINVNEENMGTVKHLEKIRKKCTGEYIMALAADDALADNTVISSFVKEFERLGSEAKILTSQCGMYDAKLHTKNNDFISQQDIKLITEGTKEQIFNELGYRCIIPAPSTCYRNGVHELIGKLGDKYYLIEDWPSYLRAVRMGIKFYYLDKMTVKHRDGGISHGNKSNTSTTYLRYLEDRMSNNRNEVYAYKELLTPENIIKVENDYTNILNYYNRLKEQANNQVNTVSAANTNSKIDSVKNVVNSKLLHNTRNKNRVKNMIRNFTYKITTLNAIIKSIFYAILLSITTNLFMLNDVDGFRYITQVILEIFSYALFIVAFLQLTVNVSLKVRRILARLRGR